MSLLTLRARRKLGRQECPTCRPSSALSAPVRRRIQVSADLLAAILELEGRERPTIDDLEWADAVAARLTEREAARGQAGCVSTATTPRRRPSTARRALDRTGSAATPAT